ncbi:HNH endonuclease [Paraburkholderia sp. CNPSo 3281]|uniref:HNH endonuclease n=1 Tax=Paraburkholderia sp. CNPSo 3281 TaxID=2940933 RepID=UPI0020B90210|nr:HNH endonuclease [Paraburkholderia sp. CNPSo 3281]MCP3721414.1 HNH endonuclease [Paraburkholderia sp. CNPSo 3281]
MRDWARRIDENLFPVSGRDDADSIESDLRAILKDQSKTETERLAELAVRLGQGKFRADLLREFGNACSATRLAVPAALRASHIVPWKKADHDERRDPKNGLLLSANLDALFDRHMITFGPDGKLQMSALLAPHDTERLGPMPDLPWTPCDERAAYLRRHNAEFERWEIKRLDYVSASAR